MSLTEKLAALDSLHAAATNGEWYASPDGFIDVPVSRTKAKQVCRAEKQNDAEYIAAAHNALPALLDELEEAREAVSEESNRWVSVIRGIDPEALCDFHDENGSQEYLKAWLAARDARMKREGAAEALEEIAKNAGIDGGKAYIAKVVYREFPDLMHTSVGVVDASDLMTAAKRLREGK